MSFESSEGGVPAVPLNIFPTSDDFPRSPASAGLPPPSPTALWGRSHCDPNPAPASPSGNSGSTDAASLQDAANISPRTSSDGGSCLLKFSAISAPVVAVPQRQLDYSLLTRIAPRALRPAGSAEHLRLNVVPERRAATIPKTVVPAAGRKRNASTLGYCCLPQCQTERGFETGNQEGGCRSFHKHFLRDLRGRIEPAVRRALDDRVLTLTCDEAAWLLVACCLLSTGLDWQIVAREDSHETCDLYKFCTRSYSWVRRSDLGARLFLRDSGNVRPAAHQVAVFPTPLEILETVFDSANADLCNDATAALRRIDTIPISLASRQISNCSKLASIARSVGHGRKQILHVRIRADKLLLRLNAAANLVPTLVLAREAVSVKVPKRELLRHADSETPPEKRPRLQDFPAACPSSHEFPSDSFGLSSSGLATLLSDDVFSDMLALHGSSEEDFAPALTAAEIRAMQAVS